MTVRPRRNRSRHSGVGTNLVGAKNRNCHQSRMHWSSPVTVWGTTQLGRKDLWYRHLCDLLFPCAMRITAIAKKCRTSFLGSYTCFICRHFPTQHFQAATASQSRLAGDMHPMCHQEVLGLSCWPESHQTQSLAAMANCSLPKRPAVIPASFPLRPLFCEGGVEIPRSQGTAVSLLTLGGWIVKV